MILRRLGFVILMMALAISNGDTIVGAVFVSGCLLFGGVLYIIGDGIENWLRKEFPSIPW